MPSSSPSNWDPSVRVMFSESDFSLFSLVSPQQGLVLKLSSCALPPLLPMVLCAQHQASCPASQGGHQGLNTLPSVKTLPQILPAPSSVPLGARLAPSFLLFFSSILTPPCPGAWGFSLHTCPAYVSSRHPAWPPVFWLNSFASIALLQSFSADFTLPLSATSFQKIL